jgi:nucleotide-binding universal stress UspA family protein
MQRFNKILFPADLSDVSAKIVPYVKEMADKFDAEVHILFIARGLQHFANIYVSEYAVKNFEEEIFKGAQKKLEEFVETFFKDRHCKTKVVSGDPSDQILKYVRAAAMYVVIMGTHGRKGIDEIMLGNVAHRVIKNSPVPVLTVNPYLALK